MSRRCGVVTNIYMSAANTVEDTTATLAPHTPTHHQLQTLHHAQAQRRLRSLLRSGRGGSLLPCCPYSADPQNRRTYYSLSDKSTLSDAQLHALLTRAVKHSPNAFNMQQTRVVLVTGTKHKAVWEMVKETFGQTMGDDSELWCPPRPFPRFSRPCRWAWRVATHTR